MKRRKIAALLPIFLSCTLLFTGCSLTENNSTSSSAATESQTGSTAVDPSEMFTNRDYDTSYDESTAAIITLNGDSASCDSDAVTIDGSTVTITNEGTYILTGTLTDGMIIVDAEDSDKVQIVLDNVNISNADSAAIYVRQADKVFLTMAEGSENTLTNGGTYTSIDDNNIDAVIFSKDDLTLNGNGTLNITAEAGHGIVSKDDLVLTSGTYNITAEKHGLSGKDSVRIADGTYNITVGTDGIHGDNDEDSDKGFVYICGGTFNIDAGDDGIHSSQNLSILDGTINISNSYEGLEGLCIDISGGTIDLAASDDGLNAAGGTDNSQSGGSQGNDMFAVTEGACINISGGYLHVNASGDGLDSNGDLVISGGEIYVSGPTSDGNGTLDYNGTATITGGTLVGAGSSGMEQNFTTADQGVILTEVSNGTAGSTISLSDEDDNELVSWSADKEYTSVIISTPDIKEGSTYTVTTNGTATEITMSSLIYGSANTNAPGGNGGVPGMGGNDSNGGTPPDGNGGGTPPDRSNGNPPSGNSGNSSDSSSDSNDQRGGTPPTGDNGQKGTPPNQSNSNSGNNQNGSSSGQSSSNNNNSASSTTSHTLTDDTNKA